MVISPGTGELGSVMGRALMTFTYVQQSILYRAGIQHGIRPPKCIFNLALSCPLSLWPASSAGPEPDNEIVFPNAEAHHRNCARPDHVSPTRAALQSL